MTQLAASTWANVSEGCPIRCDVTGSDQARLFVGDNQLELDFDVESMRALVRAVTTALAEMDARFEQEEAAELFA